MVLGINVAYNSFRNSYILYTELNTKMKVGKVYRMYNIHIYIMHTWSLSRDLFYIQSCLQNRFFFSFLLKSVNSKYLLSDVMQVDMLVFIS